MRKVVKIVLTVIVLSLFLFLMGCSATVNNGDGTPPPPAPTASILASPTSITIGQPTKITWSSTNATSCSASGDWSGTKALNGSESVTPSSAGDKTYKLTCSGAGGTALASATLTVTVPPPASVSPLSAVLSVNQSQQFKALTADGSVISNNGLIWSVNGVVGGSPTSGTITPDGFYVPPSAIAGVKQATITAKSAADSTKSASAVVILMFGWAEFYTPQAGTSSARGMALNADQSKLVVATSTDIPNSDDKTTEFLLYNTVTGERDDLWTGSPEPSKVEAMALGPDGAIYAAGFTGGASDTASHNALVYKITVQDTMQISELAEFQLEGQRTEARAIGFTGGKIFLAVKSDYQVCNAPSVVGCTGNWVVALDVATGGILYKFAVHGGDVSSQTSITGLYVTSDHLWVTGDTSGGYYIQKDSPTGQFLYVLLTSTNVFWTLVMENQQGAVFVGGTDNFGDPNKERFNIDNRDQSAQIVAGWVWNGDNSGAVSQNILRGMFVNSADGITAVGSLSRIGSSDPSVTDGGAIARNANPNNSQNTLWKYRFSAVPGGTLFQLNAATADSSGNVYFAGTGGEGSCGTAACESVYVAKFPPPSP